MLDDHNILFYMRGGDIYRNYLSNRCAGLSRREAFMYRTTSSQLCDIDLITVLMPGGAGFFPGPSCGLGKFYPVTETEVEGLKEQLERAKRLALDDVE